MHMAPELLAVLCYCSNKTGGRATKTHITVWPSEDAIQWWRWSRHAFKAAESTDGGCFNTCTYW